MSVEKKSDPVMKCAQCSEPAAPGDGLCKECLESLDDIAWHQDCRREGE